MSASDPGRKRSRRRPNQRRWPVQARRPRRSRLAVTLGKAGCPVGPQLLLKFDGGFGAGEAGIVFSREHQFCYELAGLGDFRPASGGNQCADWPGLAQRAPIAGSGRVKPSWRMIAPILPMSAARSRSARVRGFPRRRRFGGADALKFPATRLQVGRRVALSPLPTGLRVCRHRPPCRVGSIAWA